MGKHPYTAEDCEWKPHLTLYRKALAAAIVAIMEAEAGTIYRIEQDEHRLAHLRAVQASLSIFDKRLRLVRNAEQLRLVID